MDKTFCVFGDSIVQGAYVKENWVELLRQYLEEKYKNDFVNVFNLGIGGNTSEDIIKRLKNESLSRNPTTIIFQVGVNDSLYLKNPVNLVISKDQFKTHLEAIVVKAQEFTADIYFIGLTLGDDSMLKPFPGSTTGKSYDKTIVKDYDEMLKQVVTEAGHKYIPLWDKLNNTNFMDGLHPNDSGHKKIFEEVVKTF